MIEFGLLWFILTFLAGCFAIGAGINHLVHKLDVAPEIKDMLIAALLLIVIVFGWAPLMIWAAI